VYLRIVLLCCTYIHRGLKIIPIAHVFRYVEVASSIVGGVPVVLTYVRGSLQILSKIRLIPESAVKLGHPLHPSLLAMVFKVVHMKG